MSHSIGDDGRVGDVDADASDAAAERSTSLQEAFRSFLQRKKKSQSIKAAKDQKVGTPVLQLDKSDPRRLQHLRERFLEEIRRHIGVPYARRYHVPDDASGTCRCEGCTESGRQLGSEPLFLDCCGLVRKVVRGMAPELGFRLGPGNQSYQFDTLPTRVASEMELEPGDLIFYEGLYHDPGSKRFAFDMVHVEVYVRGETGEATIGARDRHRWIVEHPSYMFASKRWALTKLHFVKIDAWLRGMCEPAHPELWRQQAPAATRAPAGQLAWDAQRRSIFNAAGPDKEDGGDEQADGD